jgi:hypothetical protein
VSQLFCGRLFRWIGRKRGWVGALFLIPALVDGVWGDARPVDLLDGQHFPSRLVPWLLMITGVSFRVWGAGNLRENQEITTAGIYRLVRHPLYVGTCLIYLSFFLSFGDPILGTALFLGVSCLVYYPRMLQEERSLRERFPGQSMDYTKIPRLLPNFAALPAALDSDRFSIGRAFRNRGLRSALALIVIPVVLKLLLRLGGR